MGQSIHHYLTWSGSQRYSIFNYPIIRLLCTVVNTTRILVTIADQLLEITIPLGKRTKISNSTITLYDEMVEKSVSLNDLPYSKNLDERVTFLKGMYEYARDQPGLVQVWKGPTLKHRGQYQVMLKTRGVRRQPVDEQDLCEMVRCVLLGLKRLHNGGYVHRDIRIPNILYVPGGSFGGLYVLIDFEHGGYDGELMKMKELRGWDEGTLDDNGQYTTQSDLYELGKMLEEFHNLSNEGRDLKRKCMTAAQALNHIWIKGL